MSRFCITLHDLVPWYFFVSVGSSPIAGKPERVGNLTAAGPPFERGFTDAYRRSRRNSNGRSRIGFRNQFRASCKLPNVQA